MGRLRHWRKFPGNVGEMKEWVVIHKIKSLYDEGEGSSINSISDELKISRNTVRKYVRMDEEEIQQLQENRERWKLLDPYRDYICHLLQKYPRISAVKIRRKLRKKVPHLEISKRSVRRYVKKLKQVIVVGQRRYYEPILDMVAGVQCQVDLGEYRHLEIGEGKQTVYFAVFVLSYSRLMYVTAQKKPIDTESFIRMHDQAFRYFGGCPEECVYDQTKLVVVKETFRELKLNQRFAQYATAAGFEIRACEGYDPESKGRVEAGIKYVKNNALYAEQFSNWKEFENYLSDWLEKVSNARTHQSTLQVPRQIYDGEEKSLMKPYLSPPCVGKIPQEVRKVDRTGLIAFRANRYSVPQKYQQCQVGLEVEGNLLVVRDLETNQRITQHEICLGKGKTIKNTNHYRDREQRVAELEAIIQQRLGTVLGSRICQRLKATSPKIYKDQLVGLQQTLEKEEDPDLELLERLSQHTTLTATLIRDCLDAVRLRQRRSETPKPAQVSAVQMALSPYRTLPVQGGLHEYH